MRANVNQLKMERREKSAALQALVDKDIGAARAAARGFTPEESASHRKLEAELADLDSRIVDEERVLDAARNTAPQRASQAGDYDDVPAAAGLPALPARTVRAFERLFSGSTSYSSPASRSELGHATVAAAFGHAPLPAFLAATATEGVPEDGGFAVPAEVSRSIFARAAEESVWMKIGARVEPMLTSEKIIVGLDDSTDVSDAEANLTADWSAEGEEGTAQVAKLRQVKLVANKLMVIAAPSNELAEDASGFVVALEAALSRAIAKRFDRAVLVGTGAGQPLGLLNSTATVTVSKETNQAADTLVFFNLAKMWSVLSPGSHENAYWLAHPTTLPQLLTLNFAIGTAGAVPRGALESDGRGGYQMMGRPVVITSRINPLGDKGDIILVDPSQVAIGIRSNIAIERSPHAYFPSDRLGIRARFRGDARPLWDKARTLVDGSTTVSPYVTLQAR